MKTKHLHPARSLTVEAFDVDEIRQDFPILHQTVEGKPLVYFDNGATSQKPKQVIDAIVDYYSRFTELFFY